MALFLPNVIDIYSIIPKTDPNDQVRSLCFLHPSMPDR